MNQPPPPNYVIKACPPPPPPPPPPRNQNQTSPTLRNQNRIPPPPPLIKTLLKALYVGRKASPLQLELGSGSSAYRAQVRIENDSDRKFKKYFLETTFLYVSCYPDHYEPKIFFRFFSKYFFRIENFPSHNILKVFLETPLVHVSCSPDHYEPKMFFWFSKFATTLRYTILDSRFPPENAISEGRPPLCNTSSEVGALDTGGTYREWLGPKIF